MSNFPSLNFSTPHFFELLFLTARMIRDVSPSKTSTVDTKTPQHIECGQIGLNLFYGNHFVGKLADVLYFEAADKGTSMKRPKKHVKEDFVM